MLRHAKWFSFVTITALPIVWGTVSRAQAPAAVATEAEDEKQEELQIKVYRVVDLVSPVPNYPYSGTYLPRMSGSSTGSPGFGGGMMGGMGGGMGGMGMGGMGGGGGTGGGGFFRVADNTLWQVGAGGRGGPGVAAESSALLIDMDKLIETITTLVDPGSWDGDGGEGVVLAIGGALAISQTPTVHAKIEKFLSALRRESGTVRTLSIEGQWLLLDAKQLAQLHGAKGESKATTGQTLSKQALAALPDEARRQKGQITCFNGQTVHLVSGRMETKLQGGIPVSGGSAVGYQPIIVTPHLGALLQITAALLPGDEGALVDLFGSVAEWGKGVEPVKLNGTDNAGNPVVEVDRMNVNAQQLATSLRVPLAKPVLVGGMTMAGDGLGHQDPNGRQLYLVLEITAGE